MGQKWGNCTVMNVKPLEKSPETSLYQQIANRIQSLIAEGTLQPGDRIPSVRKLHQQMSVSISTVLEAYRLLEDRGLISARPQSGYFVKQKLLLPNEPNQSAPLKEISCVDTSLMVQVNQASKQPTTIKLGAAIPAVENFPIATLNRLMAQAMREDPIGVHSYNLPPGCEQLRREIARRLIDAGCAIAPDRIVTTNGTTEAIYLSLRAVTQPGDTVAIESPTYFGFLEALESLHLRALELPTHPREGLSLSHLEKALQQQKIAACLVVSNFSNPLGSCMSDRHKKQLVELLAQYDIPLIEDDIYGDLSFEGNRPKAIKAFDRKELVLYCASYSKTLSPGLRVGWCVPGRYQPKIEQLKMVVNYGMAKANQQAIAAFLANGGYDRHLRKLRRIYQEQMMRMTQAICKYFPPETKVTQPTGGHVLWVELPAGFDSMKLYEQAYKKQISIAPGLMFSPSGSYRNCLRLNCGLPWSEKIEWAMKTLGELLLKMPYPSGDPK